MDDVCLVRVPPVVGELGFDEDLLTPSPGGPQPLEGGAVVEAGFAQKVVQVRDVDALGPGRRPLPHELAGNVPRGGFDHAYRVADPL